MGGRKQMSARQLKPRDVGDFAAGPVNVETWRLTLRGSCVPVRRVSGRGNHIDLREVPRKIGKFMETKLVCE